MLAQSFEGHPANVERRIGIGGLRQRRDDARMRPTCLQRVRGAEPHRLPLIAQRPEQRTPHSGAVGDLAQFVRRRGSLRVVSTEKRFERLDHLGPTAL